MCSNSLAIPDPSIISWIPDEMMKCSAFAPTLLQYALIKPNQPSTPGKKLKASAVLDQRLPSEWFLGVSRRFHHQLHVCKHLIHVVLVRPLLHVLPDFACGNANFGKETIVLHVSPNQGSVEVVTDGYCSVSPIFQCVGAYFAQPGGCSVTGRAVG